MGPVVLRSDIILVSYYRTRQIVIVSNTRAARDSPGVCCRKLSWTRMKTLRQHPKDHLHCHGCSPLREVPVERIAGLIDPTVRLLILLGPPFHLTDKAADVHRSLIPK